MRTIFDIPDNSTLVYLPERHERYEYYRKVYLPSALQRLESGQHFLGRLSEREGHHDLHMSILPAEARDYFHGSLDYGFTLKEQQDTGGPSNEFLQSLPGNLADNTCKNIGNLAIFCGLNTADPLAVTDHLSGKYYTTNLDNVPIENLDPFTRMGLYRLLGQPDKLRHFVEDIDQEFSPPLVGIRTFDPKVRESLRDSGLLVP